MQTAISGSNDREVPMSDDDKRAYNLRPGSKRPGRPKKSEEKLVMNTTIGLTQAEKDRDRAMADALGISVNELYRRMRRQYYAILSGNMPNMLDNAS